LPNKRPLQSNEFPNLNPKITMWGQQLGYFLPLAVIFGIVGVVAGDEVASSGETGSERASNLRKPRLFYVSTSTTTSTLNTMTLCYQVLSTARNLGNCGRRKRAIAKREVDITQLGEKLEEIRPSRKVEPSDTLEEDDMDAREERVLNYWMTTTTTVTSHSYTVTSTFASLLCTYDGFTYATCGR